MPKAISLQPGQIAFVCRSERKSGDSLSGRFPSEINGKLNSNDGRNMTRPTASSFKVRCDDVLCLRLTLKSNSMGVDASNLHLPILVVRFLASHS